MSSQLHPCFSEQFGGRVIHFVAQVIDHLCDSRLYDLDCALQTRARVAVQDRSDSYPFAPRFQESILFSMETETFVQSFKPTIAAWAASFVAVCHPTRCSIVTIR